MTTRLYTIQRIRCDDCATPIGFDHENGCRELLENGEWVEIYYSRDDGALVPYERDCKRRRCGPCEAVWLLKH